MPEQQGGFTDGVTKEQQRGNIEEKGQQKGEKRDELSYEEELRRGGLRTQQESKNDALREEGALAREKNKVICAKCSKRKDPRDISVVSSRGNFCEDCANSEEANLEKKKPASDT